MSIVRSASQPVSSAVAQGPLHKKTNPVTRLEIVEALQVIVKLDALVVSEVVEQRDANFRIPPSSMHRLHVQRMLFDNNGNRTHVGGVVERKSRDQFL